MDYWHLERGITVLFLILLHLGWTLTSDDQEPVTGEAEFLCVVSEGVDSLSSWRARLRCRTRVHHKLMMQLTDAATQIRS